MTERTPLERVRLFRKHGFFADLAGQSDEEALVSLESRHRTVSTGDPDFSGPNGEFKLIVLDKDRIWWDDMESDVFPGQDAYVRILAEWSRISRGAFRPVGIKEEWATDDPPVIVSFMLDGQPCSLQTDVDEWIDLNLLDAINDVIRPSGYFFDGDIRTHDQTAVIVVLTQDEKVGLQRDFPMLYADEPDDEDLM